MENSKENTWVLVTGGTGFVGIHAILQLLQKGYHVKTTLRSLKRKDDIINMLQTGGASSFEHLVFVEADLTKDDNWDEAVKDCTYVLHIASPIFLTLPKDENEMIRPAVDGTLRVLKAARDAGVKRVVMTSNFGAVGARFVAPTCQHHDGFALWDSHVTAFNAMQMGPKRDLIGELCSAVRKQGLKFGFTNHQIENFQFINPPKEMLDKMKAAQSDLYDPKWLDFYHVADRSDEACKRFLIDWYARNVELIDKYKPDVLWFDNGIDQRYLDPLKLMVASYYYNSAQKWGKEVTLNTKKAAYAPSGTNVKTIGSILDFEGKIPPGIRTGTWDVDTQIGSTWGYTSDMRVSGAASMVGKLIDIVSKNGTMMLNLSPKADGTIPQEQQETLLGIGRWLGVNGEAIYDTHNWIRFGEDNGQRVRFTVKGDVLYAIIVGKWPGGTVKISSVTEGKVRSVSMLGSTGKLAFAQSGDGLEVTLPANAPCEYAYTLKISGLKINPSTLTKSGNPIP